MIVTTSWDDGHPADLRLAELLDRYGLKGTFYVPRTNCEGWPVMRPEQIQALARRHEIGGHSLDHVLLQTLCETELTAQVAGSKAWLEDLLGGAIDGFGYVRGVHTPRIRAAVRAAGYRYARTATNLVTHLGHDPYRLPVTLQFYPHGRSIYARNLISRGFSLGRLHNFTAAVRPASLTARVHALAAMAPSGGGYFHLWGHSWEIEAYDLWASLEETLQFLSAGLPGARALTNGEAFLEMNPYP